MRLEDLVLDAVEDGLAHGKFVPGKLGEPRLHAADEILLGLSGRPGVVGVKDDQHFEMGGATDMIYDGRHLGKLQHGFAQLGIHLARFRQRNSADHLAMEKESTFVEVRQEFARDRGGEYDHRDGGAGSDQVSDAWPTQRAPQCAPVSGFDPAKDVIAEHAPWLAIREIGQAGNQRQREQQRSELRKSNRVDHGIKQLCLDPLEGEQRQISRDDDQRGEEDRPCDLVGGSACVTFGEQFLRLGFTTPQDRFRHHNRGIDDDPKIDCAE